LSASGTLTVTDADVSDTVSLSSTVTGVALSGTTTGLTSTTAQLQSMLSLSAASLTALAADPTDTHNLTWTFNSTPQAFDYLAAGQSLVLTYTVTGTDSSATPASDTQTITVTITGTNDAPDIHLVTTDSAAAALTETNAALSASGTLTVTDADVSDTVSLSSTVTGVALSGTTTGLTSTTAQLQSMLSLSAASLTALAADPTDTHNLTWTVNSTPQAFDYLAAGQSLVLTYTVTGTDSSATPASDTQTITVTITGTNDAPDIHLLTTDSAAAALTETNAALSASGTLTVTDADVSDTVSLSSTVTGVALSGTTTGLTSTTAQLQSMLSLSAASLTALAADPTDTHNLTWTFNSTPQAFDYLAAGQSLVLTYTVTGTDSSATQASDTQTITVTITGTNDAPDIHLVTTDSAAAALTETNAALSASGTLTVTDSYVSDTVSFSAPLSFPTRRSSDLGLTSTTAQLQSMLSLSA